MSKRLLVACEGPTDFVVIQAAADAILGEYVPVLLQPEVCVAGGHGKLGGGWKGVRDWCRQTRAQGGIGQLAEDEDVVVIHLDADVADDGEVDCAQPCPPPSDTTGALAAIALDWLGEAHLPARSTFCMPSKCTEAWVLAGLFVGNPIVGQGIECRPEPEALLVRQPPDLKFVRKHGGRYRKNRPIYDAHRSSIASAWLTIEHQCTQAKAFGDALRAAFAATAQER